MVTPPPPVLRLDGASGRSCRRHLPRPETRSSAPPLRAAPVDPSGCFCQSPRRTPPRRRRVFPMRSLYNLLHKCLCLFPCDGITGKCRKKTQGNRQRHLWSRLYNDRIGKSRFRIVLDPQRIDAAHSQSGDDRADRQQRCQASFPHEIHREERGIPTGNILPNESGPPDPEIESLGSAKRKSAKADWGPLPDHRIQCPRTMPR